MNVKKTHTPGHSRNVIKNVVSLVDEIKTLCQSTQWKGIVIAGMATSIGLTPGRAPKPDHSHS